MNKIKVDRDECYPLYYEATDISESELFVPQTLWNKYRKVSNRFFLVRDEVSEYLRKKGSK